MLRKWFTDLRKLVIFSGQSVPVTNKAMSSNPANVEVFLIQRYVTKFVSDLRQIAGFLRVLRFPSPIELITTTKLKYW